MISVLYVEDHAMVREAISLLIDMQPDMRVIASAATGAEALSLYKRHRPEVTVVDLQLPDMSGVEVIHEIRRCKADAKIVVLTMYQGDEDIHRALAAGASSYLLKEGITDSLICTLRQVHSAELSIPPEVASRLAVHSASSALTPREQEVIELVATGMRNREIAAALDMSEETARSHIKSIFLKLGVTDRTAAVIVALRRGIIHLG